jgi:UDP-GlcNAc:undecaprenyl-phosphate GlcNAc-1-phosphate transferase
MLASLLPPTNVGSWSILRSVWQPHFYILVSALFLSLVLTPICRTIAMHWHIYDQPDGRLKTHQRPIPYLGGVAIFLAWLIPVLIVAVMQLANPDAIPRETEKVIRAVGQTPPEHWIEHPATLFWICGAALLIMLLGLVDDLKNLSPTIKIVGEVIAALILAAGGVIFLAFPSIEIGNYILFPAGNSLVAVCGVLFQIVLVVGAANATNLLDGLDGLCSGVTAFISLGFLLVATSLLAWGLYRPDLSPHYANAEIIVLLSFALLGAVLGFLPYNFRPASIFMGDTGSMFLGFLAATFMILFAEQWTSVKWFLGAMVIFGLPIFNTGLAVVRRLVNHKPLFTGDRSPFYYQLVDRGCSVRTCVLISYGLSIFFGLAGVGITFLRLRYALPIYLIIFGVMAVAALRLGLVRVDENKKPLGN